MLSCIFGGLVVGNEIPRYLQSLSKRYSDISDNVFNSALKEEQAIKQELLSRSGTENVHRLHDELAEYMVKNVTVKRNNKDLQITLDKIKEIKERYKNISLDDRSQFANQTYAFAHQFSAMIDLAAIITKGALLRNEFRGAHYKPEFPKRDDENWLKTTIAAFDPHQEEPVISYLPVDTRYLKPVLRDYTQAKKIQPTLENVPAHIPLPI